MINLKVGHQYLRRDGEVVNIKSKHRSMFVENRIVFIDSYGDSYYENGSYWSDDFCSEFDLITEVKGE